MKHEEHGAEVRMAMADLDRLLRGLAVAMEEWRASEARRESLLQQLADPETTAAMARVEAVYQEGPARALARKMRALMAALG